MSFKDLADARKKRGTAKASLTTLSTSITRLERTSSETIESQEVLRCKNRLLKNEAVLEQVHHYIMEEHLTDEGEADKLETEYAENEETIVRLHSKITKLENIVAAYDRLKEYEVINGMWGIDPTNWTTMSESFGELEDAYKALSLAVSKDGARSDENLEPKFVAIQRGLRTIRSTLTQAKKDSERSSPTGSATVPTINLQHAKLPAIQLPSFDGDHMDWPAFIDDFNRTMDVHNITIETDKIQYLKSCLKGKDLQDFVATEVRSKNYDAIIDKLKRRYDQPRRFYRDTVNKLLITAKSGGDLQKASRLLHTQSYSAAQQIIATKNTQEQLLTALLELQMEDCLYEEWQRHTASQEKVPNVQEIGVFLEKMFRISDRSKDSLRPGKQQQTSQHNHHPKSQNKSTYKTVMTTQVSRVCPFCNTEGHVARNCSRFLALSVADRNSEVKRLKLCYNCLADNHSSYSCPSKHTCRNCNGRHHSILHRENRPNNMVRRRSASPVAASTEQLVPETQHPPAPLNHIRDSGLGSKTILPTVKVLVQGRNELIIARGLVDTGAALSCTTSRLTRRVRAREEKLNTHVLAFGSSEASTCNRVATLQLSAVFDPTQTVVGRFAVVPTITSTIPPHHIQGVSSLPCLNDLTLADPDFTTPGRVDILIGTDLIPLLGLQPIQKEVPAGLTIFSTKFGCVISGLAPEIIPVCNVTVSTSNDDRFNLTQFWENEELPALEASNYTQDEQLAVTHFEETHSRKTDGRFCVTLPRRSQFPELGHSREQAMNRLLQTEKRLQKSGNLQAFREGVLDYLHTGHAELVPEMELVKPPKTCYYLPMHGVTKETSTTTKLRIVWDASATTSTGVSLNDTLLPGPCKYPPIPALLLNFRTFPIGMSADISRMFREIALHPSEKDYHRFLFRPDSDQPIQEARMTRLTFGITSSPFLATSVIRKLAEDNMAQFSTAANTILHNFYVDDCLVGVDTTTEAQRLQTELCELLSTAQMQLRKWRTNCVTTLQTIPEELRDSSSNIQLLPDASSSKTLGICWNIATDTLSLATPHLKLANTITKRSITSGYASIYDVLGLYAPILIIPKILTQQLWSAAIGWDEPVPSDVEKQWSAWKEQLPLLAEHTTPRYIYSPDKTVLQVELHGYSDASMKGYACCVYLRILYSDASVDTVLLYAKTKVAPIKACTIPRLELNGMVLLAKAVKFVTSHIRVKDINIVAWTDSKVALSWVRTAPGKLKTYVANRVSVITEIITPDKWRYVSTKHNPADIASRGALPAELIACTLWWEGPTWLKSSPHLWPEEKNTKPLTAIPELRPLNLVLKPAKTEDVLIKYSSWNTAKRILAWVLRFYRNCRKRPEERDLQPELHAEDVRNSTKQIIKLHQQQYFAEEITHLKKGRPVQKNSKIRLLQPLLNSDKILVAGGRLDNAPMAENAKHPYILLGNSYLAKLLIRHCHLTNFHAGNSNVQSILAQTYYITGMKRAIKGVIRQCVKCRKHYHHFLKQKMGQLPADRLTPAPPFSVVGIDYAGPLTLKRGAVRKPVLIKAYVSLFICFTTKALHLELVTDLTGEAFLAAFRRFCSRRGLPRTVHTDNGTNFVAVDNKLKEFYAQLNKNEHQQKLAQHLSSHQIEWRRIPARAPHFGGLWEAGVKAMKKLLCKHTDGLTFTFEEMSTILIQIEGILNSRPLTPTTPEASDLYITPGHFLTGRCLHTLPDGLNLKTTNMRKWNAFQTLISSFWKQWSTDYLRHLLKFTKWLDSSPNIKVGDVVICQDAPEFSNKTWPLGRVAAVHPGKDGFVRVVTIRMHGKLFQRPIHKVCKLLEDLEDLTSCSSRPALPPEDVGDLHRQASRQGR